jgi:hypothetical protein
VENGYDIKDIGTIGEGIINFFEELFNNEMKDPVF